MGDNTTFSSVGKEIAEAQLKQFGRLGMKWGVRNDKTRGKIRRGLTKANVALNAGGKVISEGEKNLIFLPIKNRQEASQRTQSRVLGEAAAINKSPQFKGKDLKRDPALKAAYFKKVEERAKSVYAEELGISRVEAWGEVLGVNTNTTTLTMRITAPRDRIQHDDISDSLEVLLEMNLTVDNLGQITGVSVPDDFFSHGEDLELFHYGRMGMKWGVRRSREERSSSDVTVTTTPGKGVKAVGGKKLPASDDAIAAATARQKAKGSHTDALSNKELQAAVTRMNLERQYSQLMTQRKSAGRQFVEKFFKEKKNRDMALSSVASSASAITVGNTIRDTDLSGIGK